MNEFKAEIWKKKKHLHQQNQKQTGTLSEIPRDQWPATWQSRKIQPDKVLRSKRFLCQLFYEPNGVVRLSFNRAEIDETGHFIDGMSWDELQQLKSEAGYANFDAVEIFPNVVDTVNVANMRHLWVFTENQPLEFIWRHDSKGFYGW